MRDNSDMRLGLWRTCVGASYPSGRFIGAWHSHVGSVCMDGVDTVTQGANKRHGVDAGGAFCLYSGHHWSGTTHAGRWAA